MMNLHALRPGMIIKGPKWPEPIEIKSIDVIPDSSYLRLIGSTIKTRKHVDDLLSYEDLKMIEIEEVRMDLSGEAWKVFLAIEAKRYRLASLYDPLLAMNTSKIDPLPHQIEAVYGYILKLPTIRFLIADDPGAGKTIMAGLVIKELKLRNIARRILIVAPGHLQDQWRRELKDRFDEQFVVVNRESINTHYGMNVWIREDQIITSMDFVKQKDVLPSISSAEFDLVIVDEAHKMAAYKYGDEIKKTDRYRLGEVLSSITTHMLFLTATPHKGDPENFRLLLDLLSPGFFVNEGMMRESIEARDNPLFIRRMKENLKDFNGKPLFLPRHVKTIRFRLTDREKMLYNELSRYVKEQYNKALSRYNSNADSTTGMEKNKRRNIAFALIILQRRFASSIYALMKSLERRKNRLEEILKIVDERRMMEDESGEEHIFDIEEVEDMSEEERWKKEELWETLSVAENMEELRREIETINTLINMAKQIINDEDEIKLRQLKDTLNNLNKEYPREKVLIFTESKDTLEYLERKIRSWGYSVNTIHGGMSLYERIEAEGEFKHKTQIMVATEAAGEGINLQFCHLMINYDIPWNPNRLEQRMGRIHRYGQQKEVYIFNMVAYDTREGVVLIRLFEKLEEIKNVIGSDRVFDIIGEVFYNRNLAQIMLEAAASTRSMDEILRELDIKVDQEYISKIRENLGESLATKYIDYTRINEMASKAKENRLIPEYTQEFFRRALVRAGGRMSVKRDGFIAVEYIPYPIKRIADEEGFRKRFGTLLREYPKVTFDKDVAFRNPDAEFVTFGHPLFEAVMQWVESELSSELQRGAVFMDPSATMDGYILFYEGAVKDGTDAIVGKKLFSYYVSKDHNIIRPISPAIIWDLVELEINNNSNTTNTSSTNIISNNEDIGSTESYTLPPLVSTSQSTPPSSTPLSLANDGIDLTEVDSLKSKVLRHVISDLEEYRKSISEDRKRQAAIKEKYGIRSLDEQILKLDEELILLEARREAGENVDLVITNLQRKKEEYERRLNGLKEMIKKESELTMSTPSLISMIRVISMKDVDDSMRRDENVEKIGMDIAIRYERENGRVVEDVSEDNLGFDLRSRSMDGSEVRYIEVKTRADTGDVALTENEWFKAQRLGDDYYLYIVWNAIGSNPRLIIIRNPVKNLSIRKRVEVVRYIVSSEEIEKKKGEGKEEVREDKLEDGP